MIIDNMGILFISLCFSIYVLNMLILERMKKKTLIFSITIINCLAEIEKSTKIVFYKRIEETKETFLQTIILYFSTSSCFKNFLHCTLDNFSLMKCL